MNDGLVYRIPRKTYNLLRHPDKRTSFTHEQVLAYLNESAGLKGHIVKLEVMEAN